MASTAAWVVILVMIATLVALAFWCARSAFGSSGTEQIVWVFASVLGWLAAAFIARRASRHV